MRNVHGLHVVLGAGLMLGGGVARAYVTQPPPDLTPLPQLVPVAEQDVVISRGYPPSALFLYTLFALHGESLDPSADATAVPGAFFPRCPGPGVAVEFLLNGGGCSMPLAWYNAPAGNAPPGQGDLHVVVPAGVRQLLSCSTFDFCPLAAAPMPFTTWVPMTFTVDVCNDPNYTGGAIGFALVGSPGSVCPATKYSEARLNVECTVCTPVQPWITTLIYQSTVAPEAYYLAFEDLPMSPTSWKMITPTSTTGADGDFNDFVFLVHGICHGAPCAPGGTGTGGQSGGSGGETGSGGMQGAAGQSGSTGGSVGTGGQPGGSGGGNGSGGTGGTVGTGGGAGRQLGSGGSTVSGDGGSGDSGGSGAAGGDTGQGGTAGGACVPGRTLACACPGGVDGAQTCSADGQRFEACQCTTKPKNGSGGCGCALSPRGSHELGWPLFALATVISLASGRRRGRIRSQRDPLSGAGHRGLL